MKILIATEFPLLIVKSLITHEDSLIFTNDSGTAISKLVKQHKFDMIIVFGFGKILPECITNNIRCINLHNGFLPFGRGPNPNLSSWINGEPHGITIHEIDEGIDAGPIIIQQQIHMDSSGYSLQTSFDYSIRCLADLFNNNWANIRNGNYTAKQQCGSGSFHTFHELNVIMHLIETFMDNPINELLSHINKEFPGFRLEHK